MSKNFVGYINGPYGRVLGQSPEYSVFGVFRKLTCGLLNFMIVLISTTLERERERERERDC
jgi:hypothetical protein